MKKKLSILAITAVACGFLVTSCNNVEEPDVEKDSYKLSINKDEGVESVTVFSGETEVKDLTRIEEETELTAKIVLLDNYELTAVTLDGTALSATGGTYVFEMPSKDATLEVTTSQIILNYALTIEKDEGVESVKIFAEDTEVTDFTSIAEGTSLELRVTLKNHYKITAVTLDEKALTTEDGNYAFSMPSNNAKLAISTEKVFDSAVVVNNDSDKGTYTLTINGEASSDGKCNAGDNVSLTITPNAHCKVSSVVVNEKTIEYTGEPVVFEAKEGTNNVTISYSQEYVMNYATIGCSYTLSVKSGNQLITSGDYVYEGQSLTLELSDGWFTSTNVQKLYFYINDTFVKGNDENVTISDDSSTITYNFISSSQDTNIYCVMNNSFTTDESGISISFEENENVRVFGFEEGEKYSGNYPTFNFTKNPGYNITGLKFSYADGTSETFEVSSTGNSPIYYQNNVNSGAIMYQSTISQDVVISFIGEVVETYDIEYVGLENVTFSRSPVSFLKAAPAGTSVVVTNLVAKDSKNRIDNITIESDGEPVADAKFSPASQYSDASYSFTMPSGPVTITFVMKENGKITVNADEGVESYSVRDKTGLGYSEIEASTPGTNFYLYIQAKEGFAISSVVDENDNVYSPITTNEYDYTTGTSKVVTYAIVRMPEDGSNITLSIKTSAAYKVTCSEGENYTLNVSGYSNSYAEGATVTFNGRTSSSLYNFKDVYLADSNGEKIDATIDLVNNGSSINGSFMMPAKDVVITAVVEKLDVDVTPINVINEVEGVETASLFNTFNISNYASGISINSYSESLEAVFVPNTSTSVSIGLKNDTCGVKVSYVLSDNSEEAFSVSNISTYNGTRTYSFVSKPVPENLSAIKVVVYELDALTYSLDDKSGDGLTTGDLEFTLNSAQVDSLEGVVFEGAKLKVNATKDAGSGFAYIVRLLDATTKEELKKDYQGIYTVYGNFVIEITKVEAYKFSVNTTAPQGVYATISLTTPEYTSYYDGDLIIGEDKAAVRFYLSFWSLEEGNATITYEVKVGETVIDSKTVESQYSWDYTTSVFDVTGDITVTVTVE